MPINRLILLFLDSLKTEKSVAKNTSDAYFFDLKDFDAFFQKQNLIANSSSDENSNFNEINCISKDLANSSENLANLSENQILDYINHISNLKKKNNNSS